MILTLDTSLFQIIGEAVFYLLIIIILLVVIGLLQFIISIHTKIFIFPTFQSFLIDTLHPIFKGIMILLKIKPNTIDLLDIQLKNRINENKFSKTDLKKRIVVLPQCLRSISCPAKLSSKYGINCAGCKKCPIDDFKLNAEQLGYKVFIVPGGTFVQRIVKMEHPKAVLGVGCFADLAEGMKAVQNAGIAVQGVLLETLGCIETKLDWNELYEKLYLGVNRGRTI